MIVIVGLQCFGAVPVLVGLQIMIRVLMAMFVAVAVMSVRMGMLMDMTVVMDMAVFMRMGPLPMPVLMGMAVDMLMIMNMFVLVFVLVGHRDLTCSPPPASLPEHGFLVEIFKNALGIIFRFQAVVNRLVINPPEFIRLIKSV